MTKLEELYAKRKVFEDYKAEVPAELRNEIAREEKFLFEKFRDTVAGRLPKTVDNTVAKRIVFGAEYVDGKLNRIGTTSRNFDDLFEYGRSTETDRDSAESEHSLSEPTDYSELKRNPSIGFSIKLSNGNVIKESTARDTLIKTLKHFGLERVSQYKGDMFKGYPLVGKIRRPNGLWQRNVDGWWIYVNMSNSRAIECIKGVSKMLHIPVEIVMDNEIQSINNAVDYPKGKRARFSLNGGEPTWKNRTVWNVVRNLLKELPNATFKEVADFFPKSLQGSYGVVATAADIEERSKRNVSEYNRWFLDPADILTTGDGVRFAVSSEWGDNFENFRAHVIREFGWTINES